MSTIQVERAVLDSLRELKEYRRQTYNELISRMLECYKAARKRNQYDEFLHKIQQERMRSLWDNKEDDFWDTV
ncbi:MAG: hypothetical protein V1875_06955 [Candidatus Altiarchaeota archaeon]